MTENKAGRYCMLGKLPELLDRIFLVGYFLPALLFTVPSLALLDQYGFLPVFLDLDFGSDFSTLINTTVLIVIAWVLGVILLTLNRDIIRVMEGYYFPPSFSFFEKQRYRQLIHDSDQAREQAKACQEKNGQVSDELQARRITLTQRRANMFPDESFILPTSFGNVIRAFEVYPRIMYGFDAIPGWSRLLAIIPESYRRLIDDAKSGMDYWVNICALSVVFIGEYLIIVGLANPDRVLVAYWENGWMLVIALVIAVLAYKAAERSAIEWGDYIKASFDVFLPDLYNKLGFADLPSEESTKQHWEQFSKAIIYRSQENLRFRDRRNKETEQLPAEPEEALQEHTLP
jgi:hypothetical protein